MLNLKVIKDVGQIAWKIIKSDIQNKTATEVTDKVKAESETQIKAIQQENDQLYIELDKSESEKSELQAILDEPVMPSEKIPVTVPKQKHSEALLKRFKRLYPSIILSDRALKSILSIHSQDLLAFENQIALLHHNSAKAQFRDKIEGTAFEEIGFGTGNGGRFYILRLGSQTTIAEVGNKQSQPKDLKYIKSL